MTDQLHGDPKIPLESQPQVETTDLTEYYEKIWKGDRDDMKRYGPFSRHYRRLITDILRPLTFESVLDVGCGQGSLLADLCAEFPGTRPHGIDISALALELAKCRVPDGSFWVLDITKEHLNERFDVVVCSEVLEHLVEDTLALHQLAHMTGKYLIISSVQGKMRKFEINVGHVRNYAPGELVRKVNQSGFKVLRVVEWGFPFYSPLYRNFLELTGGRGTTGEFGLVRKAISEAIYCLFLLNSRKRGDEIFVLAEPAWQKR
jgi:SAM-dependent methyltransferase